MVVAAGQRWKAPLAPTLPKSLSGALGPPRRASTEVTEELGGRWEFQPPHMHGYLCSRLCSLNWPGFSAPKTPDAALARACFCPHAHDGATFQSALAVALVEGRSLRVVGLLDLHAKIEAACVPPPCMQDRPAPCVGTPVSSVKHSAVCLSRGPCLAARC